MVRKVLIPTDLSVRSVEALRTGLALAAARGGEVEILHVLPTAFEAEQPLNDFLDAELYARSVAEAPRTADATRAVRAQLEELGIPLPARLSVTTRAGDVADGITDAARTADLVVLGSASARVGGIAARVMRSGAARVLVVPLRPPALVAAPEAPTPDDGDAAPGFAA